MPLPLRSPGLPTPLRPFRHRAYLGLWTAGLVSNIGTWMEMVAVGVLVAELTGQAVWTGLIAALAFLPSSVLGPVGGALTDRVNRKRYLIALSFGQTLLAASLALVVALDQATPILISVIMLLTGCLTALRLPAQQSILPDIVPPEDLPGAIGLSSAQFNMGRVIGPALAGIVIAVGGYAWAFGANAVSYTATILAVSLLTLPLRVAPKRPFLAHLIDGFREARRDPGIAASIGLIGTVGLLASPFIALVPAMAVFVFGGGPPETAVLVTFQGLGAVTAAVLLTPLVDRFGRGNVMAGALLLLPVGLVGYALAPAFQVAVVLMFVVGAAYLAVLAGLNTVVQLRAAPEQRGRALSIYMMALSTFYPLGAVLQGAISDTVGLRPTTATAAVLLLVILALLMWRRRDLMRALGQPRADASGVPLHRP